MNNNQQFSGYKGIFKSTFLFGFVQIFKVIIGIITNKIAAVFLGAGGIGIMGIYSSTIALIQTGAGLGVSQSAVRDISQANQLNDETKFSRTIVVTNKVIYFTALLGCLITAVLAPWLSRWTMGDDKYTIAYLVLAVVVAAQILSEGQLAILKGMRQLQSLAKASMIGSVVGLITVVPLFYFFSEKGIVPSLIISSVSALAFSFYYVNQIKFTKVYLTVKETIQEAKPMVRMGLALMFISFLWTIVALAISAYIRHKGGFAEVGYYQAGTTILARYFGVIITALTTDYYPRIAAIHSDNKLVQDELNKQSSVSLILACPLIVVFLFLLPYIVPLLYTNQFSPTIGFIKYAILGTLITMVSNQVDMILVAKFQIRIFTVLAVSIRVLQVFATIVLYNYFGLIGLGIALSLLGIVHLILMTSVVYHYYKIKFSTSFLKIAIWVVLFSLAALLCNELIDNTLIKWVLGLSLTAVSIAYSLSTSKKQFDIDFLHILNKKINFRKS